MSVTIRQRLLGLVATLAIIALILATPAVLISIGATPLPADLPSFGVIVDRLSAPDDGSVIRVVLAAVVWLAWAYLTIAILVEVIARLRGLHAPRLPGFSLSQAAARGMVGTAVLLFVSAPIAAQAQPATPHTTHQGPSVTASAGSPTGAQTASSAKSYRQHTVEAGESLWSIAQQYLGAGYRYPEIVELTMGVPQDDGHTLSDADEINEGWVLRLPPRSHPNNTASAGTADKTTSTTPTGTTHRVARGETLWGIAEQKLGDGDRYPEIFRASRTITQPGGQHLANPGVIDAGWTVVIPPQRRGHQSATTKDSPDRPGAGQDERAHRTPTATPTPPSASPTPANPTATAPTPTVSATAAKGPTEAAQPTVNDPDNAQPTSVGDAGNTTQDQGQDQDDAFPLRTAAGVGSLLAAGVIGLIATRRRQQQRLRRPRRRLAMPTGAAAAAEQTLRATADPLSVNVVDAALRGLAHHCATSGQPLPVVRAARLTTDQFDLYLAEEATLPEPWTGTADATVWTLLSDHTDDVDLTAYQDTPAPYPALVTIGHDIEEGHVFLDLEYLAAVGLTGGEAQCREVLAAVAIELATSCWADDLQVTIVGAYPELEDALQTGRIRYVPSTSSILDELDAKATADGAALAADHTIDLRHARVTGAAPGAWSPEIVLFAGPLTDRQKNQLTDLLEKLPRVAIAAVTAGTVLAEWQLRLEAGQDTARLDPIGLTLRPQRVDQATYANILDLVAAASDEQHTDLVPIVDTFTADDPAAASGPQAIKPRRAAPESDTTTQPEGNPGPVDAGDDSATSEATPPATTDHPAAAVTPSSAIPPEDDDTAPARPAVEDSAAARTVSEVDEPTADVQSLQRAPFLRVLGPVELANTAGTVETSKRNRLLEYAAYLALHPTASHSSIDAAIWPGRTNENNLNTRNTATSKLRAWLGKNTDGQPFLPRNQYTLSAEVRSDWEEWLRLVGSDPTNASSESLEHALKLVRGRPFHGVHPRRYAWAEPLRQEMISSIVDAAYELAHRRMMDGRRWRSVEDAIVVAINLEPGVERLWRLRILAAHQSQNKAAEDEAVDRMLSVTEELGCELEDETQALLAALRDPAATLGTLKEAIG